jgi:hypothetical protein
MLMDRFRAVNASHNARDKVACLKQDGLVRNCAQKMQELSLQIPGITDEKLLDRFIRGLKPRTRMEVTMRAPASFDDAVKLADHHNSLFSDFGFTRQPAGFTRSGQGFAVSQSVSNPILHTPTPIEIDALRRKPSPLTPEERARLQRTGVCFYCRQSGHVIANCPSKPPVQNPRVNHVESTVAPTEEPESIFRETEPRSSENFMPQ